MQDTSVRREALVVCACVPNSSRMRVMEDVTDENGARTAIYMWCVHTTGHLDTCRSLHARAMRIFRGWLCVCASCVFWVEDSSGERSSSSASQQCRLQRETLVCNCTATPPSPTTIGTRENIGRAGGNSICTASSISQRPDGK